jgi:hypothetical protein
MDGRQAEGTPLLGRDGVAMEGMLRTTPEGCRRARDADRPPELSPEKLSGDFSGERFCCLLRIFLAGLDERW